MLQNFQLLYEFAETIGATVGGTRDVVEAGWLPHDLQIGQTGETVTPKIYFAIALIWCNSARCRHEKFGFNYCNK